MVEAQDEAKVQGGKLVPTGVLLSLKTSHPAPALRVGAGTTHK